MTKHIVSFFCGTGYTLSSDDSYQSISQEIFSSNTILMGFDGCQVHGGGIFAYGVEEQADAFIQNLKIQNTNEKMIINLIAHSRGCLSALMAIKKIQADPQLKDKVSITVDLRDPVQCAWVIIFRL